jgi:competence protein ComEC
MHVLAVSGLHVGLIFLFLLWAFRFLNFVKGGKWLRLICISAILWMYALITGFSPSVQRAVTMFTFLLIAETLNRRNSIYNSIAASAFALLLVNPDILFAVGFQLSYAAVLSIVYFYPMLVKLLPAQQVVLQKPWQLLCVSLAAQIGTFPLSLYYFNQFPVYFWLSNFIVIPAAFILLCGTFLFFITSALPPLNQLIAQLLDIINSGVLFLLKKISMLPGAVIDHIAISGQELISLIAIILFIILFISSRRARYLQLSLLCFLSFQLFGVQKKLKLFNQHRFISYKNTNRTFHFIDGRKNYILSEDTSQLSPYLYSNVITRLQLDPPVILPIADTTSYATTDFILEGSICQFGDQSFELDTLKANKHIPLSGNPSVKPQTSSNKNLFIYNTK